MQEPTEELRNCAAWHTLNLGNFADYIVWRFLKLDTQHMSSKLNMSAINEQCLTSVNQKRPSQSDQSKETKSIRSDRIKSLMTLSEVNGIPPILILRMHNMLMS